MKERKEKRCIYDGIRISKRGADVIILVISLILLTLIAYSAVSAP